VPQPKSKSRSRSKDNKNKTPIKVELAVTPQAVKGKKKAAIPKTDETRDASKSENRSKSAENIGVKRIKKQVDLPKIRQFEVIAEPEEIPIKVEAP